MPSGDEVVGQGNPKIAMALRILFVELADNIPCQQTTKKTHELNYENPLH